ncbi:hypothetical protein Tco_0371400 [Tanacetum coccineum]
MTTANQDMSIEEIEQVVAQRVANAIEAIAIYESINQTKQQENKVAGNDSNKRCNFHHVGQCAEKCGNCKMRGHQAKDCRIPVPRAKKRFVVSGKKAEVTCYGCGGLGHYKSNYPIVKFQNRVNMYWKGKARIALERRSTLWQTREAKPQLSGIHRTFHVSNLKKCNTDKPLVVLLDGLHIDDKLYFIEEPIKIMDREVKRLKQMRIPIVKVRWNSRRGPEFTWEREDQFRKKYPHLFTKTAPSSSAAY